MSYQDQVLTKLQSIIDRGLSLYTMDVRILEMLNIGKIYGIATGGSSTTIVDTTKNIETNVLTDKFVKVTINDIDYYRKIDSNTADTITIPTLVTGVAAHTHIAIAETFDITVTCATAGVAGNAYKIKIIEAPGTDDTLSASFSNGVLTIYLGKTDGVVDDLENTATLVTAKIDELAEFTATATGAGVVVVTTEDLTFAGGVDAVEVVDGTPYEVLL